MSTVDARAAYERVDALRSEYLKQLGALSRLSISLATGLIALVLTVWLPNVHDERRIYWLLAVLVMSFLTAAAGYVSLVIFSLRLPAKADYEWSTMLTDLSVEMTQSSVQAVRERSGENIDKFSARADRAKGRYDRLYRQGVALSILQIVILLSEVAIFIVFVYLNVVRP